ncbi:hemolysin family protein [Sphingobacterium sp. Mn56C]|uniref:hemolysin family protein n=1 Tax=Sphingobacterium sp. Mn56C TaxID=3395261 RepID=UPI003BD911E3
MLTEVVIILLLILLNGVFSASEIAIVSSRKARLKVLSENNPGAKKALHLKDEPNQFLSTIQIGITLIGILTGFFSGGSISTYLAEILSALPATAPYAQPLAVTLVVVVITFITLVLGELVPKRIGMAIPERYASLIAIPMDFLSMVVKPFVWLLSRSTNAIVRLFNIHNSSTAVTEEEIKALVDEGVDSGVIEDFEHDMMDRLLIIGDKRAINMMVHRSDIVYLNLHSTFEEIKAYILRHEHTEYPVCDGSFDKIKGIVRTKVLLNAVLRGRTFNLEKLIEPIPFVYENSSIYTVLEQLKSAKVMQAVVIDEYGSTQGLITGKDIISSLIGRVETDTYSHKSKLIRQREDGSFILEGRYQLDDFYLRFGILLTEEEEDALGNITTLAGLVFLLLDHMPMEGETVTFCGYRLEVLDMDGNRIDKIALSKIEEPQHPEVANVD